MRLIEYGGSTFTLTKDLVHDIPCYAILSHTWSLEADDEISFRDMLEGTGQDKIGYKKLELCAELGRRDGLRYFWIDTCCIDKSNSSELTRAINSMFSWYKNATRCYVYLSDIPVPAYETSGQYGAAWESAFRAHRWFSRGWTLQELLAPASVEFFTENGRRLGDKASLEKQICDITGIPARALRECEFSQFDVEERFKWAETRRTTYEEDWAYCLLGIFGIFMPLIPGEGKANAVRRLRNEISNAAEHSGAKKNQNASDAALEPATPQAATGPAPPPRAPVDPAPMDPAPFDPKPFDPATARSLHTVEGSGRKIAFSPDSRFLAAVSDDLTVNLFDPATARCLQTLGKHVEVVTWLTFSPDGRYLASASRMTIRLWDPSAGRLVRRLGRRDLRGSVQSLVFSPDARLLAVAAERTVMLFDPAQERRLRSLDGHTDEVVCIDFSPDTRFVASSSWDKTTRIWDAARAQCLHVLKNSTSVAFSPDAQQLLAVASRDIVQLFDPATGLPRRPALTDNPRGQLHIAFSPDAKFLAAAGQKLIKLWDPEKAKPLRTLIDFKDAPIVSIAFSPDMRFLAAATYGEFRVWGSV